MYVRVTKQSIARQLFVVSFGLLFVLLPMSVSATGDWQFCWESERLSHKTSGALGRHGFSYEKAARARERLRHFSMSMELLLKHFDADTKINFPPKNYRSVDISKFLGGKVNADTEDISAYVESFYLPIEVRFSPRNRYVAVLEYNPIQQYRIRLIYLERDKEIILSPNEDWIGALRWNPGGYRLFYKTSYRFHKIPTGAPTRNHKSLPAPVMNHRDDSVIWLNSGTVLAVGMPIEWDSSNQIKTINDKYSTLVSLNFQGTTVNHRLGKPRGYSLRRFGKNSIGIGTKSQDEFRLQSLIRSENSTLKIHEQDDNRSNNIELAFQNLDDPLRPPAINGRIAQFSGAKLQIGPFKSREGFLPTEYGFYLLNSNWDLYYFSDIFNEEKLLTLMKPNVEEKPKIKIGKFRTVFITEGASDICRKGGKLGTVFLKPGQGLVEKRNSYTTRPWSIYRQSRHYPPRERPVPDLPEYLSFNIFEEKPSVPQKNLLSIKFSPNGKYYFGIYWNAGDLKYRSGSTKTHYLPKTVFSNKIMKDLYHQNAYSIPNKIKSSELPIKLNRFN